MLDVRCFRKSKILYLPVFFELQIMTNLTYLTNMTFKTFMNNKQ